MKVTLLNKEVKAELQRYSARALRAKVDRDELRIAGYLEAARIIDAKAVGDHSTVYTSTMMLDTIRAKLVVADAELEKYNVKAESVKAGVDQSYAWSTLMLVLRGSERFAAIWAKNGHDYYVWAKTGRKKNSKRKP